MIMLIGCGKIPGPEPADVPSSEKGTWTQVTNLRIDPEIVSMLTKKYPNPESSNGANDPISYFFFSLDDGKEISYKEAETDKWDICWSIPGDFVSTNNYRWSDWKKGKAGCYLIIGESEDYSNQEADFPNVMEAPTHFLLHNVSFKIGYQERRSYGVFQLYEANAPNGTPLPKGIDRIVKFDPFRTLIVKTSKGNWAKVQFQSLYKDSPAEPTKAHQKHYLTFRYFVQKDGSRNLDTRIK